MANENIKTGNASVAEAAVKLTVAQKLPFAGGALGACFIFTAIMSFLSFYWTDIVMIPPAIASAFLMITKIWDAVNDPMIGYLSDRTQTRWGRYRPWCLSCIPASILGVLTFTVIPGISHTAQMIFSLAAYFFFVLASTCGEVPGNGLVAAITTDPDSRVGIISFRQGGSFVGSIIVGALFLPMVMKFGGEIAPGIPNMAKGIFLTVLLLEILALPLGLWMFFGTKERVTVPVSEHKIKDSAKALKGNAPFWLFFIAFFTYGITSGTTGARMYFWTYNFGDQGMMSSNITIWMVGSLIGSIVINWFTEKVKSKSTLAVVGYAVRAIADLVAGLVGAYCISQGNFVMIFQIVTFISGLGQGFSLTAMYSIMADITEYTQWKHHIRISGFITSLLNFAYKASMAIGASVHMIVIGALGYVPNQAQNAAVLSANNWFLNYIPAICILISLICMAKFPITKEKFHMYVTEIAARKDGE